MPGLPGGALLLLLPAGETEAQLFQTTMAECHWEETMEA